MDSKCQLKSRLVQSALPSSHFVRAAQVRYNPRARGYSYGLLSVFVSVCLSVTSRDGWTDKADNFGTDASFNPVQPKVTSGFERIILH